MASCFHPTVIEKINRANELMAQLRALLLPSEPINSSSELARDLFDETFRVLTAASSDLQPCFYPPTAPQVCLAPPEGEQRMRASSTKKSSLSKRARRDNEKRKMNFCTTVTSIPHVDGHQWRKYGQKQIKNEAFLRNYFRCTHYKDQGCQAKKTVQQLMDNNDDPPKFTVAYIMQHSCKTLQTCSVPVTFDLEHKSSRSPGENSCRSIVLNSPSAKVEGSIATRGGWKEFSSNIDYNFDIWNEGESQVFDGEEWDRLWVKFSDLASAIN